MSPPTFLKDQFWDSSKLDEKSHEKWVRLRGRVNHSSAFDVVI